MKFAKGMVNKMYEITIRETKEVRKTVGKTWVPIETTEGGAVKYGYSPETESVVKETNEIYTQKVENLDLQAVIVAVNKIKSMFQVELSDLK